MTPPADLAALRALVEAEDTRTSTGAIKALHVLTCRECERLEHDEDRWCETATELGRRQLDADAAVRAALPAAREALERLEQPPPLKQAIETARQKWYADHGGRDTVQELYERKAARLARLEKALRRVRAIVSPAIIGQHECDVIDAALGSQPTGADTAEWRRVHGPMIQGDAAVTSEASAQAARDVAYWRRRAEDAEARAR